MKGYIPQVGDRVMWDDPKSTKRWIALNHIIGTVTITDVDVCRVAWDPHPAFAENACQPHGVYFYHRLRPYCAAVLDLSRPVQTRDGQPAEIVSTSPLRAKVKVKDGDFLTLHFDDTGRFYPKFECPVDLMNI